MVDSIELPETFEEICETHRKELLEAFEPYWEEQCSETFVRSLYEWDYTGMEEILVENRKFIEDFLYEKLQDEF